MKAIVHVQRNNRSQMFITSNAWIKTIRFHINGWKQWVEMQYIPSCMGTVLLCFLLLWLYHGFHCNDVIMSTKASQITSHTIVYSTVYSAPIKETSNLRVTGLCVANLPVTGEFPAQTASNAENIFIWWRNHAQVLFLPNWSNIIL